MESSPSSTKGKAKKLRKTSENGGVNTAASLAECVMNAVPVHPRLKIAADAGENHRPMRDLQGLVLSVLHSMIPRAEGSAPKVLVGPNTVDWVDVRNKAAVKHVRIISLTDAPEEMLSPTWLPATSGECFSQSASVRLSDKVNYPAEPLDALLIVEGSSEISSSIATGKASANPRWKDKKRKRSEASEASEAEADGPQTSGAAEATEMEALTDAEVLSKLHAFVLGVESLGANGYPLPTDEALLGSGLRPRAYSTTSDADGALDANALLDAMVGSSLPSSEEAFRLLEDCVAPQGCSTGYVQTLSSTHSRQCQALVAIDCEMCVTSGKSELTRVTVVGIRGEVLLDELVKPYSPITDYCTRYSGITPELLDPVTTRIEQIQVAILRMIDRETVIVGHSLDNDLHALKIAHATVVDTALIFSSTRGPEYKPALRNLAREHLSRVIQASTAGHSSAEDALAALDLAKLKAKHGRSFGISTVVAEGTNPRLLSIVSKELRCVLVGNKKSLQRHSSGAMLTHTIIENDAQVAGRIESELRGGWHVLVARVASDQLSIHTMTTGVDDENGASSSSSCSGDEICTQAARLKIEFKALAKSAPPNTFTVIVAQRSTKKALLLTQQRRACSNPRSSSVWNPGQEKELIAAVKEANLARVFFQVN